MRSRATARCHLEQLQSAMQKHEGPLHDNLFRVNNIDKLEGVFATGRKLFIVLYVDWDSHVFLISIHGLRQRLFLANFQLGFFFLRSVCSQPSSPADPLLFSLLSS